MVEIASWGRLSDTLRQACRSARKHEPQRRKVRAEGIVENKIMQFMRFSSHTLIVKRGQRSQPQNIFFACLKNGNQFFAL